MMFLTRSTITCGARSPRAWTKCRFYVCAQFSRHSCSKSLAFQSRFLTVNPSDPISRVVSMIWAWWLRSSPPFDLVERCTPAVEGDDLIATFVERLGEPAADARAADQRAAEDRAEMPEHVIAHQRFQRRLGEIGGVAHDQQMREAVIWPCRSELHQTCPSDHCDKARNSSMAG